MKKFLSIFLTSFLLWVLCAWIGAFFYFQQLWKTLQNPLFLKNEALDLHQFWEVYNIIEDEYFSSEWIKKEDIIQWAITGMVESLGDKHSEFMTPEVTEKFNQALSGDFEGIGAVVEKVPLGVKVERILKGSPAKKYDVRAKDIIIKANDSDLEGLDIYDAVDKIKWPAWSPVTLTIIRPWEEAVLEITVIRDKIHIPSVEEKYFEEEKIAYIALNMYGESTAQEFYEALENVKTSDTNGLIIDLRDNGGGYLQSAVEILSEFIPEKEILVKTRYKDSYFDDEAMLSYTFL